MQPASSPAASSGAASAKASSSGSSQSRSSALKSPSTWPVTRSLSPGWPIPMRTRRKSREPSCSAMERRPLCPATPPPVLIRTLPAARSSSSWQTTICCQRQLVEARGLGDRVAGQVHVRSAASAAGPSCRPSWPSLTRLAKLAAPGAEAVRPRHRVDRHEADVVAVASVAGAGIAQPDEQQHAPTGYSVLSSGLAASRSRPSSSAAASPASASSSSSRKTVGAEMVAMVKSRSVIAGRTPRAASRD